MGVISLLLPNSIFGMIASAGAMNLLELRCLMLKSSLVLLSTNIIIYHLLKTWKAFVCFGINLIIQLGNIILPYNVEYNPAKFLWTDT